MNADLETLCHRLLGALLNGGYQGLVLTLVIWLSVKMGPRLNAATRHWVWLVTLGLVAVLPALHFLLPAPNGRTAVGPEKVGRTNPSRTDLDPIKTQSNPLSIFRAASVASAPAAQDIHFDVATPPLDSPSLEATGSSHPAPPIPLSTSKAGPKEIPEAGFENALPAGPGMSSNRSTNQTVGASRLWPMMNQNWQLSLPDRVGLVLVGSWIVLAFLRLGRLVRQCCRLHFLKRQGTAAPEGLREIFSRLTEEMGVRRKSFLMVCPESAAPMALGFRRPAVLLPARIFENAAALELEQVLRHELAHLRRADDWTNLFQQTIQAVLFFHPAVWWLSRRLTVEREIACDDHVLAATRTPRAYALFLTEFAGRKQCRDWSAAPAAWSNKNQLKERIAMILDPNRNSSPRLARARAGFFATAAALVVILGLYAGPRLALAATARTEAEPAELAVTHEADVAIEQETAATTLAQFTLESESEALGALLAANDDAPAPLAEDVESGPRAKPAPGPQSPVAVPTPPALPVPPHGPLAVHPPVLAGPHAVAAPPGTPMIVAAPAGAHPAHVAVLAQPVSKARKAGDDSIERRLERLERLVESLLEREKGPKKRAEANPNINLDVKVPKIQFDKDQFAKFAEDHKKLVDKMQKFGPSEEELARIKDQAKREAGRAARDLERSVKDVERSAQDAQRHAQATASRSSDRESVEKQRHNLETQRSSLEKQMKALERQIERLAAEQEKIESKRIEIEKKSKAQEPGSKSEDSDAGDKPKIKK